MRQKTLLILLLMIGLFCFSVYAGEATDLILQVKGRARVVDNDVTRARDEAVKNASENAIMQAVSKILPDKGKDEKLQAVKSIMLERADRYIKRYRTLSESMHQDEYAADVYVVVALPVVRQDLSAMGFLQDPGEKEGRHISLSVKGMKEQSDFAFLKDFLQNHPQMVKSFYPLRMEWQRADFDLILTGPVQNLMVELEKSGRYSIELSEKNNRFSEISLQVKEGEK